MTLTISRPRGLDAHRPARKPTPSAARRRLEWARADVQMRKDAETRRITLCFGCHLIGWYPADALAEVLADVARWAVDPAGRDPLPWPRRCAPWEWSAGETLAIWHAGQLVALVGRSATGEAVITRFDRAAVAAE